MNEPAPSRVSKPVIILWGTVGLLVVLGCGTPAKVTSAPSGTSVTATSPATSQASSQDSAVPKVMPDVKGKKLDVAKSDIKSAGFTDQVEIIGGGTFGVVVDGNWKVCAQSPEAGEVPTAAPKLTVDRSCDGAGSTTVPAETTTVTTEPPTTTEPPQPPPTPEPTPPPTPAPTPAPTTVARTVYYANCTEAKAAGAAPLYRGQPGYRAALDRDGDGIACEM